MDKDDGPGQRRFTSVWTREAAAKRGRGQPGLSREQIVREAIALLDAEGLDALSMRRLAARLASGATSIYWWVASKDELLQLAVDEILGEVAALFDGPYGEPTHWREIASRYAYGLRAVILRHPWVAQQIGVRPAAGPNAMRAAQRMYEAFRQAGFRGKDLDYAIAAVGAYTLGTTLPEVAWRNTMLKEGMSEQEWTQAIRTEVERGGGEFATLLIVLDEFATEDVTTVRQVSFDFGLVCMLDGLEARLPR
ncbi:TetR/AcrR family transcriptional regulator [Thermopolyspora sp. NPDC052614]|uniref:TetR/AcrR family transcriptional regulator n=1 Tax=Thermopolyspora sp. NPDC052614 TaxID=3155682 RepID=UPI003437FCDD